ncbi:aldehyde dehydrogenase family protein [Vibrio sp. VNB-15]
MLPCVANIDYSIEHISDWMAPSVRSAGALLSLSQVEVVYQPKGFVGSVTPWNFPVVLPVGSLISAITAGNHAMKMLDFEKTTFLHPGPLAGDRQEKRPDEKLLQGVLNVPKPIMLDSMKEYLPIQASNIAKSILVHSIFPTSKKWRDWIRST